ncbi:hypothetical protein F442_13325 [Phytophthora nicotianae P10297]|uniref:Uncharacterized protein n=1 Tax=Phytophthora nicotianae P10297 TaxID=1317064 RepID=W2YWX9_PHYNI|nr:hypothetical protein F442_13325 [Phytophthora nicotianae P10297]
MNTSDLKLPEDLEDVTLSDVAELLGVLDNDASHDLQIGPKEVKPEEWLARVKHPRTVDGERGISPQQRKQSSNQWASTALEEFRKRRMAETINRKLKAVLAHQVKLNRALLGVIQDESALSQKKKFVFASPSTMPTRTTLAKDSTWRNAGSMADKEFVPASTIIRPAATTKTCASPSSDTVFSTPSSINSTGDFASDAELSDSTSPR